MAFASSLVAKLADYIEFDKALFHNDAICRLDAKQWQMGEEQHNTFWERVMTAARNFGVDVMDCANTNSALYRAAEALVAKREIGRKRLIEKRERERQERESVLAALAAQGVL